MYELLLIYFFLYMYKFKFGSVCISYNVAYVLEKTVYCEIPTINCQY